LETELADELQKRKHVQGMLEEMLNLIEEEVVDWTLDFPGGDDEIIEYVIQEVQNNNNNEESGMMKQRTLRRRLQSRVRLWISVLTCCVLNILHLIFLTLAFKLNCENFDSGYFC
jgi:hypothetical protein